jgi:hypothetical protein
MPAEILRLHLTMEQYCVLGPLLAKLRSEKRSALLSVVSVSYEPDARGATAKLDVAWLDRKTLGRICRIIQQEAKADRAKTSLIACP